MARTRTAPLTPAEEAELPSPSADDSERFPLDRLIRARGYEIVSRPKRGPVLWSKRGEKQTVYTQEEVMEIEQIQEPT